MKEYLRQGITLLVVCAVAAAILSSVNGVTGPIIEQAQKEASYGMYYEIYDNDIDDFNEIDSDELEAIKESYPNIDEVLTAEKGGEIVGYVFTADSNGYGGPMKNAIVFDLEGNIVGFRNLANAETPGFGDAVSTPEFNAQFDGKTVTDHDEILMDGTAENGIDGISGSTVTTTAVLNGLNEAVAAFKEFYIGG